MTEEARPSELTYWQNVGRINCFLSCLALELGLECFNLWCGSLVLSDRAQSTINLEALAWVSNPNHTANLFRRRKNE